MTTHSADKQVYYVSITYSIHWLQQFTFIVIRTRHASRRSFITVLRSIISYCIITVEIEIEVEIEFCQPLTMQPEIEIEIEMRM